MKQRQQNATILEENEIHDAVSVFRALSDPTRLRIISVLMTQTEFCVSDIAKKLGMSVSRVSHHLGILEKLSFAQLRQEGKQVYYTIHDECIADIMARVKKHVRGR